MSEQQTTPILSIRLWPVERNCCECDAVGEWNECVGYYCGPVPQEPGDMVPGWGPDAVAGGAAVCPACAVKLRAEWGQAA